MGAGPRLAPEQPLVNADDPLGGGVRRVRARLLRRELSAVELARMALDRAEAEQYGAFLYTDREGALAAAAQVDRTLSRGEAPGLLAGIPLGLKDNLTTRGLPTTCGSRMLAGYLPPEDAVCVARARAAGAVAVGKTNLDEFGMGSSTEHSAYGRTHNPWSPDRVPGGSSGGSAAAVAAGVVPIALGTDTGGSVRQPAAYCGVTGLRPTYGRVSRRGLVAFASSLDQVGPLGRTVDDCLWLLAAIEGVDPGDATSRPWPPGARAAEDALADGAGDEPPDPPSFAGRRIGLLEGWLAKAEPAVRAGVEATARALADAGAEVDPVSLDADDLAVAAYYVLAPAEASSNLARFDGMRFGHRAAAPDLEGTYEASRAEGFGVEVRRRVVLGTFVLSAGYAEDYYERARRARALLRRELLAALRDHDFLLGPTAPGAAFRLGEKLDDPLSMYLTDVFTLPASLAGLPALSGPAGLDPAGLPVGWQLLGRPFDDVGLLEAGRAVEARLGPPASPPRRDRGSR